MAYTNVWSNTFPPGSELANKIDDFLRRLRLDIAERMESVLIEDVTADPWVLKNIGTGWGGGPNQQLSIPFCSFIGSTGSTFDYNELGFVENQEDFYAPVQLPFGATITTVSLQLDKQSNFGIAWYLKSAPILVAAAPTVHATVVHSFAGISTSDTGPISVLVDANRYYWIHIFRPATEDVRVYSGTVYFDG